MLRWGSNRDGGTVRYNTLPFPSVTSCYHQRSIVTSLSIDAAGTSVKNSNLFFVIEHDAG
jgi:hypothetical protein